MLKEVLVLYISMLGKLQLNEQTNRKRDNKKALHVSTWTEKSRPRKLTPEVEIGLESDVKLEHIWILHIWPSTTMRKHPQNLCFPLFSCSLKIGSWG